MRVHVLSGIASSLGVSKADVEALFSRTLFAVQYGQERVNQYIERALEYLTRENLVVPNGPLLSATGFGKRVSTLYIDPATGVLFRKSLEQVVTDRDYTVGMLHLVVSSPDFEPRFAARNKDMDEIISFLEEHSEEMILKPDSKSFMDYEETLHAMRSVMALYAWINEWKEDMILDRLGVEPGDLHRAVDNADWLLYSLGELAKMFRRRNLLRNLNLLRRRMINGVKEELVQLTTLEGVGRVRARALYGAGFRTLRSIREAELGALSGIDKIGPVLAKRLKDQVSRR
jgi:helicase